VVSIIYCDFLHYRHLSDDVLATVLGTRLACPVSLSESMFYLFHGVKSLSSLSGTKFFWRAWQNYLVCSNAVLRRSSHSTRLFYNAVFFSLLAANHIGGILPVVASFWLGCLVRCAASHLGNERDECLLQLLTRAKSSPTRCRFKISLGLERSISEHILVFYIFQKGAVCIDVSAFQGVVMLLLVNQRCSRHNSMLLPNLLPAIRWLFAPPRR